MTNVTWDNSVRGRHDANYNGHKLTLQHSRDQLGYYDIYVDDKLEHRSGGLRTARSKAVNIAKISKPKSTDNNRAPAASEVLSDPLALDELLYAPSDPPLIEPAPPPPPQKPAAAPPAAPQNAFANIAPEALRDRLRSKGFTVIDSRGESEPPPPPEPEPRRDRSNTLTAARVRKIVGRHSAQRLPREEPQEEPEPAATVALSPAADGTLSFFITGTIALGPRTLSKALGELEEIKELLDALGEARMDIALPKQITL